MRTTDANVTTAPGVDATEAHDVPLAALETWMDIWANLAGFWAERFRQDVATMHELVHVRRPDQLLSVQTRYARKAFEGYREEAARLAGLQRDLPGGRLGD